LVRTLHSAGRFTEASQALAALEIDDEQGHRELWAAKLALSRGKTDEADAHAFAAIRIASAASNKALEADGWLVAGAAADSSHKYIEAIRWLDHAEVAIRNAGADRTHTIALEHTRGRVYRGLYRFEDALTALGRAVALAQERDGPLSLAALKSQAVRATVLRRLNRNEDAEAELRNIVAKTEELLGADHIQLAYRLNSLANSLVHAQDYAGARDAYSRSLRIKRRVLDEGHPSFSTSIANLGSLAEREGNYRLAENHYQEALEIRLNSKLAASSVGTVYRSLGGAAFRAGDHERAIEFATNALAADLSSNAPESAARSRVLLCRIQLAKRQRGAARRSCQAAVQSLKDIGKAPRNLADALTALAEVELVGGRPAAAETHARAAHRMLEAGFDEERDLAATELALAQSLAARGDDGRLEARTLAERAARRLRKTHQGFRGDLPRAERLIKDLQ